MKTNGVALAVGLFLLPTVCLAQEKLSSSKAPDGSLVAINVEPNGGLPKLPIPQTQILFRGVVGDKIYSNPDQAICVFTTGAIAKLDAVGNTVAPGDLGENFTFSGISIADLSSGTVLKIGQSVVIQISEMTPTCEQIAPYLKNDPSQVDPALHPDVARRYARVLVQGGVAANDPVWIVKGLDMDAINNQVVALASAVPEASQASFEQNMRQDLVEQWLAGSERERQPETIVADVKGLLSDISSFFKAAWRDLEKIASAKPSAPSSSPGVVGALGSGSN
jgi:MOSC domain-containing protein YiiM